MLKNCNVYVKERIWVQKRRKFCFRRDSI